MDKNAQATSVLSELHRYDFLRQALSPAMPVAKALRGLVDVDLGSAKLGTLAAWADTDRVSGNAEIWGVLGYWIMQHKPAFGPGIAERFLWADQCTAAQVHAAAEHRAAITAHLDALLGGDAGVLVPSTPTPAPRLGMPLAEIDVLWQRIITLAAPAALASLPQVSLPVAEVDGCPLGLGIIGPRGSDEDLLDLSATLMQLMESAPYGASAKEA